MKKIATLQSSEEVAWNNVKAKTDPNFYWVSLSAGKRLLHPSEMSTPHVYNALKIAWSKRHSMAGHGMKAYWKKAIANLYLELCSRSNLTNNMKTTMKVIAKRITKK